MDQSTTTDSDESNDNAYQTCRVLQYMIDTNAKRLDGIRTQCSATEEITRQEIRELESKLVKLFCKQLIAKSRLKEDNLRDKLKDIPSLVNWLSVVGVEHVLQETLTSNGMTFESLLEMTNEELDNMLTRYRASSENIHDLQVANDSIRKWTQMELNGEDMTVSASDIDLAWTLYTSPPSCATSNSSSSSPRIGRPSTSSLPPDVATSPMSPHTRPDTPQSPLVNNNSGISTGTDSTQSTPTEPFHHIHHTNIPLGPTISNPIYSSNTPAVPPPSPGGRRHTPPAISGQHVQASSKGKFPTTPPPQKRNKLYPEGFLHPLTKSVSHESQLSVKVNNSTTSIPDTTDRLQKPDNLTLLGSSDSFYKRRHSTEDSAHRIESRMDGHATIASSSTTSSALLSPRHYTDRSMPMHPPLSPKTPVGSRSMMHSISHRFHTKLVMGACDLCAKHVLIGRMCKFCKAKFHKDCANKAAPACGLPKEYVDLVIEMIKDGTGQQRRVSNHNTLPVGSNLGGDLRQTASVPAFQTAGSGSNTSSCHSSSPSSPALHIANLSMSNHNHIQSHNSPAIQVYNETGSSLFKFPDLSNVSSIDGLSTVSTDTAYNSDMVNTTTSNDSDKSDRTLVDSDGTGVQGATLEQPRYAYLDRVDSTDSACEDRTWSRINSISVTLKEWDIPYEELKLGDRIGTGRFGTVYKGNWHGDVAIKMLNMDPEQDNQTQLQAFKLEVAMLRKTRHENLVLFMGACMKPPDLAIITSLCKGQTLYTHIHVRREKFQLNRSVIIASQISQGMGYLHAKGIVHKDLKTKNIFLESGKVVITDFGLFNVTKLCHGNRKGQWLSIPQGWLCYLSPEIMHCLTSTHTQHQLPFSEASDVYAFGTVWYEMLCGEWPFKGLPAEPVIWQVGKGIKQSLANVRTSRDIKDVLMMCWSYKKEDRPDFSQLLKTLERLPKKRLARSPSHPIQLSRSAESVF